MWKFTFFLRLWQFTRFPALVPDYIFACACCRLLVSRACRLFSHACSRWHVFPLFSRACYRLHVFSTVVDQGTFLFPKKSNNYNEYRYTDVKETPSGKITIPSYLQSFFSQRSGDRGHRCRGPVRQQRGRFHGSKRGDSPVRSCARGYSPSCPGE